VWRTENTGIKGGAMDSEDKSGICVRLGLNGGRITGVN